MNVKNLKWIRYYISDIIQVCIYHILYQHMMLEKEVKDGKDY